MASKGSKTDSWPWVQKEHYKEVKKNKTQQLFNKHFNPLFEVAKENGDIVFYKGKLTAESKFVVQQLEARAQELAGQEMSAWVQEVSATGKIPLEQGPPAEKKGGVFGFIQDAAQSVQDASIFSKIPEAERTQVMAMFTRVAEKDKQKFLDRVRAKYGIR